MQRPTEAATFYTLTAALIMGTDNGRPNPDQPRRLWDAADGDSYGGHEAKPAPLAITRQETTSNLLVDHVGPEPVFDIAALWRRLPVLTL